jgi:hypothetical protein
MGICCFWLVGARRIGFVEAELRGANSRARSWPHVYYVLPHGASSLFSEKILLDDSCEIGMLSWEKLTESHVVMEGFIFGYLRRTK